MIQYGRDTTRLNLLPHGWQGLVKELRKDLNAIADKYNLTYLRVTDAKEKWGRMTIYFDGVTEESWNEINEVERRFGNVSEFTCLGCGKSTTNRRKGFALCDECAAKHD